MALVKSQVTFTTSIIGPFLLCFSYNTIQISPCLIRICVNGDLLHSLPWLKGETASQVAGNNEQLSPHLTVLLIDRTAKASPFRRVFTLPDCGSMIGPVMRRMFSSTPSVNVSAMYMCTLHKGQQSLACAPCYTEVLSGSSPFSLTIGFLKASRVTY